jgi:hypothetical protein
MPTLDAFLEQHLARGRIYFTREEALRALPPTSLIAALSQLIRKGRLANPRHGFYLILTPADREQGAPDPARWIHPLMQHQKIDYRISRGARTGRLPAHRPAAAARARRRLAARARLRKLHRAVNIGLVNEMKVVADKMGIDIHEVIRAAATKPFGFVAYTPGPGLGGHCIPIDPFYLAWKAREYGVNTRFIELAGEVNRAMPEWVVNKIAEALNERGKAIKASKILVLGLAYKKNVDDVRESPAAHAKLLVDTRGCYLKSAGNIAYTIERMQDR